MDIENDACITEPNYIQLRPHHILCFRNFVGYGYSESFTKRVKEVFGTLKNYPETAVKIEFGADALCTACPHNNNGVCASQDKVSRLDRETAKALNITDREYSWNELLLLANSRLNNDSEARKSICGDCEWRTVCG